MLAGRLIFDLAMTPPEQPCHSVYRRETIIYIVHDGLYEEGDPPPVLVVHDIESVLNAVAKEHQLPIDPVVVNPFVSSEVRVNEPKSEKDLYLQSQTRSR